jgi:hypothetical protein
VHTLRIAHKVRCLHVLNSNSKSQSANKTHRKRKNIIIHSLDFLFISLVSRHTAGFSRRKSNFDNPIRLSNITFIKGVVKIAHVVKVEEGIKA